MDKRYNFDNFIVGLDKAFIQAHVRELKEKSTNPYTIPVSQEYRLDLVSFTIYKNVNFKSILISVNNIHDMNTLRYGYVLYYPSIKSILVAMSDVIDVTN